MSAAVPESALTTDELLRISGFRREIADDLDAALVAGFGIGAGLTIVDYTASGSEGTDFTVPIGATIAGAYEVLYAPSGVQNIPFLDLPNAPGDRTSTEFRVLVVGALTEGEKITFIVIEAS